jgi:hypothetical protein
VRCVRWKSREATTEEVAAKKIISAGFCFARTRGSYWSEVFRSLPRGKVQDNPLRNVLREA